MTRKEAKELLPIIQAWAEGKSIQFQTDSKSWSDITKDLYPCNHPSLYRIKPEPKYRPFKNMDECWQEMHKHSEFGWLKSKTRDTNKHMFSIEKGITGDKIWFITAGFNGIERYLAKEMLDRFEFMDGTPFGVKEE